MRTTALFGLESIVSQTIDLAKVYYKEVSQKRIKLVMSTERIVHGNYSLLRLVSVGNKNTLTGGVTVMRKKNDTRQVEKRQRITTTTLIVGMDIGCEFNAMCVMNKEGVALGRYRRYTIPGRASTISIRFLRQ